MRPEVRCAPWVSRYTETHLSPQVTDRDAMTAASFSRYSTAAFRYSNPTQDPEGFLDARVDRAHQVQRRTP